jgi:hypothetical protein
MMPDNDSLLHQIRFILFDAGTPLSTYDIAYRLLTARLQTADSVELLSQQIDRIVACSPLHFLQHSGLVKAASWPIAFEPTVLALHKAYHTVLAPDYEDLPEWYQPILVSLLCYRYFSEVEERLIPEQCRFLFVIKHHQPQYWPQQLAEALQTVVVPDTRLHDLFTYACLQLPTIAPATLYQMVLQVQDVCLTETEPFAFIPVVRKLFREQLREARLWLRRRFYAGS